MTKVNPPWSSSEAIRSKFCESAPPFIILGFLVGILNYFFSTIALPSWLAYFVDGPLPIRKDLLDVLTEHAAPKTLAYGLLAVAVLVFFGRALFGSTSRCTETFSNKIVRPLFTFNLTLSAAIASLIVGLAVAAIVTGYFLVGLIFLLYAIFPIAYSVLLSLCVRISFPLSYGSPNFDDDPFVSRVVGLVALVIFFIVFLVWPYFEMALLWLYKLASNGV